MQDNVLSALGLAEKAGKLESGNFLTEKAVKSRRARLVILASDAKKNTVKSLSDKCTYYKIPLYYYGTKEQLGHAIGKEERSCLAVTDPGFAKMILKKIEISRTADSAGSTTTT